MKFPAFDYVRPETLDAALSALADGEATIIAGGQSLSPMMSFRVARPQRLVDISRLAALRGVAVEADGTLVVGAAMPHAMIEDGALPGALGALLADVAGGIAYRAIRNRGTIGGSVAQADPAADWPCVLRALDAVALLRKVGGSRTVSLGDLLLGHLATAIEPDEMLTALRIPALAEGRVGFAKFTRKQGEFSEAIATARLTPDAALICFGALDTPPAIVAIDPNLLDAPSPPRLTGSALYAAVDTALRALGASDAGGYRHHIAVVTGCRALLKAARP